MIIKQNLHTHSIYCDGKDTPREMIETAIEKGFDSIGFSGHSYMSYSPEHSMSIEGTNDYIKEINALKKEYENKIRVFCGIEYDMYSNIDISEFDYSIGSFHYFKIDNEYVGFDRSKEKVEKVINTYFNGNGMSYAEKYYEGLSQLPKYGKFDIIGHFDLVSKHLENSNFFDANSNEYLSYAFEAARILKGEIPYFEVNTGAIARGDRTSPYPTIPIIKELNRLGFGAIISSDCHDRKNLDCGFEQSKEILKQCGIKYQYVLTENGYLPIKL